MSNQYVLASFCATLSKYVLSSSMHKIERNMYVYQLSLVLISVPSSPNPVAQA